MDTLSFLRRVAGSGLIMLAIRVPSEGGGFYWKHFAYESAEEAAEAALAFDAKQFAVYHACATYRQPYIEETVNGEAKRRYRTRANVSKVKSLWLDLDCGPGKDYDSQFEAVCDVDRFVAESGLEPPMLVSSGNGLHCYWVFTAPIPPELWLKLAARFRAVVEHFKVRQDGSCTTDVCRVLRPVGTMNRKGEPLPVELLRDAAPVDPVVFAKALAALPAAETIANEIPDAAPEYLGIVGTKGDMAIKRDYPPASAHEIAQRCAQVAVFAETKGVASEPMWYAMLGLLKHTVEGEAICQEWSSGHADYDPDATRRKMEQWPHGPTTCEKFAKISPERCEGCPHKGSVKSPIQLGQVLPASVAVEAPAITPEGESTVEKFELPEAMSLQYSWDGTTLYALTTDKKGRPQVVAFCDYLFWPTNYHRLDGKTRTTWRLIEPTGKAHDFELTGSSISTGGVALFSELGQNGIVAKAGQKAHMERYVTDWFNEMKQRAAETVVYPHFGWQNDWSFVLGQFRYTPEGGVEEIRLAGDAALPMYREAFTPAGTLEEWKALIDAAYNYPYQEQYQFLFGCGFGAPLIRLFENYGGVTVHGFSPEKGLGKSTALKLALGIYGNPKMLMRTKQQVTPKAYIAHCGIMHSLPVGIDEATNIDARELSDTVYTFSQGSPRSTLQRTGTMNAVQHSWSTIQIWTANRSLINLLGAFKANADAEMGRVLEFQFEKVSKFSKAEADELLARAETLYGAAGDRYIRYIVANREKVIALLMKAQKQIDAMVGYTVQDRFASIGLTCTIVGLLIARELGLVSFDIGKVTTWAVERAKDLRETILQNSPPTHDVFGRMLTEISSGFIVTNVEGDARANNKLASVISGPTNAPITGRYIQDSGTLYIQQSVIRQWCAKNQADYGDMWKTALDREWIAPEIVHYSLGKGTREYGLAPTRCWKVDVRKMNGESGEVVEMPVRRVK